MTFKEAKNIHFIGIGGIGISAIAKMALLDGKQVTGSDTEMSEITEELEKSGAKIFTDQAVENIKDDIDLVVYTVAIPKDNPEFKKAGELAIPMMSYPEILGEVSREKLTIAVSGTHGKTTTTAMITKILIDADLDPTAVVGSKMHDRKSNLVVGKDKPGKLNYFVTEACEYRRSFLSLSPTILVVTNIEADHLDYYKDLADIQSAFSELATKIPEEGILICQVNDPNLAPVIESSVCRVIDYSSFVEDLLEWGELKVPGKHNLLNAAASFVVAGELGVDSDSVLKSLAEFRGTWRRFEYKGKIKEGAIVYDDYAHHPTEIKATLAGAKEKFSDKKIVAVFQPHLFSRTKDLLIDFGKSFSDADEVIIVDIYPAREKDDGSIHAKDLVYEIKKNGVSVEYGGGIEETTKLILEKEYKDSVIIVMGAGDIYKVSENILNK